MKIVNFSILFTTNIIIIIIDITNIVINYHCYC